MSLSENIKKRISRIVESGKSEIDLSNGVFLGEDIRELVVLLNQHSIISVINLSRNTLSGKDVIELAQLKHTKKMILIMSDITYADALILCANENFHELVLDSRALGQGSFDEHKKIPRINPLKIVVTRGIDFERHLDTVITLLGSRQENAEIPGVVIELAEEKDRKNNNSNESAESKATAPISTDIRDEQASNNALSCFSLGFCWSSSGGKTKRSAPVLTARQDSLSP